MNLEEEYPLGTWVMHVINRSYDDKYKETAHEARVIGYTKKMVRVAFLNGHTRVIYPYQIRKKEQCNTGN